MTPPSHSSTVDDIVARSAARHPDRPALHFQDRSWTYRELDDAVSRAAAWLRDLGLSDGQRVATYGKNSDAYLLAYLACARAGLVHVPINFALTGEELRYLVEQSGAAAVLVDPAMRETYDAAGLGVEVVRTLRDGPDSLLQAASEEGVPPLRDLRPAGGADTDLVQLLYTSGTTSRPKGAMMTHRALVHEYVSCIHALEMRADERVLHPMPLYHSAQMHVFLLPYLAVGAENWLLEVPDVPAVLRAVEEHAITALFLAPTVWVPLTNHDDFARRDLGSLRKAFYGASIMPGPVIERLVDAMPDVSVWNCFGQSEIGPLATVLRPDERDARPESCGRSVLFVELRVVDPESGEDVTAGGRGEVQYRSPQLCIGYWDKDEETEAAFVDGWFRSGDLVEIDAEGFITVVDRIKDVINTGGVLVASREVEDALYTHPAVAEVAVVGQPDDRWIEAVTAYVVLRPDADGGVDEETLIAHARSSLAGFKAPKAVHFVDALPRNQSGKLLKRELRRG